MVGYRSNRSNEPADQSGVLDARRAFDIGGDIDGCCPSQADRSGDVIGRQAAGQHELEFAAHGVERMPIEGQAVADRAARPLGPWRLGVEQDACPRP